MNLIRLMPRVYCVDFLQSYIVFSFISLKSVFIRSYKFLVAFLFPFRKKWFREARGLYSLDILHNSMEFLLLMHYTDIVLKHKLEEEVRKAIFLRKKKREVRVKSDGFKNT